MKKMMTLLVLSFASTFAHADTDLQLPGELWYAGFDKYVCQAFGQEVSRPEPFESMNVIFESITTDKTLDNGLIKATYTEGDATCRYSAIVFADNALATVKLVESKAYATVGTSTCEVGQKVIDDALAANDYLYYGHPHNLAIMSPVSGAKDVCGAGVIGINFVVKGMIKK